MINGLKEERKWRGEREWGRERERARERERESVCVCLCFCFEKEELLQWAYSAFMAGQINVKWIFFP